MVIFHAAIFSSRQTLDQFTASLDSLSSDNTCSHCGKNDQWLSHGYVYKNSLTDSDPVAGKRILCSNRYGRSGCGRTRQLYLANIIPRRQYRLSTVIVFIQTLLSGMVVEDAYRKAIASTTKESRNAWRWINDFFKSLSGWRTLSSLSLKHEQEEPITSHHRSHKLTILLPTLNLLPTQLSRYQLQFQRAFF